MSLAPAARPAPAKATVRVRESRHRGCRKSQTNITRHNDGRNAFRELDASIIRETNGASPAERDRLAEGQLT